MEEEEEASLLTQGNRTNKEVRWVPEVSRAWPDAAVAAIAASWQPPRRAAVRLAGVPCRKRDIARTTAPPARLLPGELNIN